MDLTSFTTIETAKSSPGNSKATTKTDALKLADFNMFFQTFLQDGTIQLTQKSLTPDQPTTLSNEQLAQSISSLEQFLSGSIDAEIYNIEDYAQVINGEIVVSIDEQKVILSDAAKLALLNLLIGTPVPNPNPDIAPAEQLSSPFANTEATLNADALFDKILKNLKQDQGITISQESIIAAGISPQQFDTLLEQNQILLKTASSSLELNDDLIALLGLTQPAPIQGQLSPQKGTDPIISKDLWFNKDLDAPTLGKEIKIGTSSGEQIQAAEIAKNGSKAAQMMTSVANQNDIPLSASTFSASIGQTDTAQQWFDTQTGEWTNIPALPSALSGTNITSAITQSAQAHSGHPAMQTIAISIKNNAANKDSRNWSLQLDPPELGKVRVELSFNKDKLMKAHLVMEKPETYMMMQRDSQMLERMLQDSGLDIDQGNLSFDLAESGDDFFEENKQNDNGSNGSLQNAADDEIETIETTMTWFVDPNNGIQRYNLMA